MREGKPSQRKVLRELWDTTSYWGKPCTSPADPQAISSFASFTLTRDCRDSISRGGSTAPGLSGVDPFHLPLVVPSGPIGRFVVYRLRSSQSKELGKSGWHSISGRFHSARRDICCLPHRWTFSDRNRVLGPRSRHLDVL